jgi:hypothetical protein
MMVTKKLKGRPPKNQKTIRTPVRLPKRLKEELDSAVIAEGYGFKGRSQWVEDAIQKLLSMKTFYEFVVLDEDLNVSFSPDSFTLTEKTRDKLENAIVLVRQYNPRMDVMLSAIIRTAIMQKLIRD